MEKLRFEIGKLKKEEWKENGRRKTKKKFRGKIY